MMYTESADDQGGTTAMGRTVVIAKPEAVKLGLEALIEHELVEELGLKIVACREGPISEAEARQLYDELKRDGRSWYEDAVRATQRGPIKAFLVEGGEHVIDVVKDWRGPTFHAEDTDSFRGRMIRAHGKGDDPSLEAATNYVHSSGGPDEAMYEIKVLFPEAATS